jgi:chromate transporter
MENTAEKIDMLSDEPGKPVYSLVALAGYFLKLGTWGFGGPVALVGYMQRDLVEQKKWIRESDYKEGLALAQLAPGPLAAQLAIYLGYVHYGIAGATLAGLAFVLPSFVMVVLLGIIYKMLGGLLWIQAVFYGVGAGVIGIITMSAYKLTLKSLGKEWILWGIFLVSGLITVLTEQESVWLFLGSGLVYMVLKNNLSFVKAEKLEFMFPVFLNIFGNFFKIENPDRLVKIALFFTKAGTFVFGSGLAIVPFLYSGVVKEYRWLTEQQFLDAVAVAMITPGPVVITVGFIGYLTEGFWGATTAALATFLPCYLFTILPAPYFKKYGRLPQVKSFVDGVTAASVGAIAGAVIILAKRTLTDIPAILIMTAIVIILWRYKKIPEPFLIVAAALVGLVLKSLV